MFKFILIGISVIGLFACSEQNTGPIEVKWDRDICERCRMMLSDRYHSAQIRSGEKAKVYVFDDLGGAIVWIQDKDWKDNEKTELWVNDHRTGGWIDGKTAWYVTGHSTQMEYGLGAQREEPVGGMTYAEAEAYILKRERKYNQSGADLKEQSHEHQHDHH
ncbi:MAG: nitrous oxide reductase accessory protein NosL [Gammaproteobacteria bacterium]|nr:nitrous oxide reductase accessory protein NosL [Gammaproteobacteria bacterium]